MATAVTRYGEHPHIGQHAVKHHITSTVRRHDVHRRTERVRPASDSLARATVCWIAASLSSGA